MAAELRYEKTLDDSSRDAVVIRSRLYINGEPSTAINVAVSGFDLRTAGPRDLAGLDTTGALLRCGSPHVANAYRHGRLPLAARDGVFEVRVDARDVLGIY